MDGQRVNVQHFYQFRVHAFAEVAIFIQNVTKAAGHACAKVDAGFTQHADDAAGHVFTAVVANTFDDGDRAGVTHRETLARTARSIQATAGRAVQAGVADDAGFVATEGRAYRRTNGEQAAGHPFTHIVVRIASQMQFDAAGIPHAEALARSTAKVGDNRVGSETLVAVSLGDITGQRCANGAVGVADIEPERFALLAVNKRFRLLQKLGIEYAIVERRVVLRAVQRFARMRLSGFQHLAQIQLLLLGGKSVQLFQQVGATNQIHQTLHAQLRHQLASFAGDEFKVVGHFKRQTVIVVLTQFVVLGCYAGCAVVQVANTQIFTAQRDHWAGTEAEALSPEDSRFDDIKAGFQAAVHLQTNFVAQPVGNQRLLGFHQSQFPRTACVLH